MGGRIAAIIRQVREDRPGSYMKLTVSPPSIKLFMESMLI